MSETVLTDQEQPYVLPSASQQYYDPAVELTSRNLLASYFGTPDMPGLINQQIPIPIQQVSMEILKLELCICKALALMTQAWASSFSTPKVAQ